MSYCIYDRNDRCTYDCEGCTAFKFRCAECGNEDVFCLYDSCGELLCAECLVKEMREEFYEAFAEEYFSEFHDFVIRACMDSRVLAPTQ